MGERHMGPAGRIFRRELGNNLGAVFSGWGESLTGWVKPAWDIVTSVWNGVTTYYSWLFGGIATIATTVWGTIAGLITSPVETVKNAWNTITGFFSGLWGGIIRLPQARSMEFAASGVARPPFLGL